MSLEALMNEYYFPVMGVDDYLRKKEFVNSVKDSVLGNQFSVLSDEYNRLKTYVIDRLATHQSERSKLQTFNRMRFHIQTEIQKFSGSPVFDYVNI